jgi:poly-gamma-glutamate capsule biosynthesis protein CapA/YwtB (metallophosphatase superfamily)
MGGYPASGSHPPETLGASVPSPLARRRRIALLLAVLFAAVLGACTINGGSAGSFGTTEPGGSVDSTTAVTTATTSPSRQAAKPGEASGSAVTISFGGDVHFEGVIRARLSRDPATAIGPVADILRRADLAMVNLETAITTRGTPQAKSFTFRAPPSAFQALKAAGIDVVTMANNHGVDYGPVGLTDSLNAAKAAKFPVVGIGRDADEAFRPYTVTVKGQRIAIIGATQVLDDNLAAAWTAGNGKPGLASAYQTERLLSAVRAARRSADTVIVDLHWGRELSQCPIQRQRDLAPKLVKAGADVVVGSHAHVLLGGGYLGPAYVDYGLGNFVFYARGGATAQSGVLTLTVRGRAVTKAGWTPAVISGGVPIPTTGSAADRAVASWNGLRGCTGLAAEPSAGLVG